MSTLEQLETEGRLSAEMRGHVLGRFIDGMATCERCGRSVMVLTQPMPNEIDIGGAAVAVNCR